MAHDVFISYASEDKATAEIICTRLEGAGIKCWIAPRDILAGLHYGGAIVEAIQESRAVVLVFSSHSNESPQVLREIERAISQDIPVIPFRIQDVPLSPSMEYFISSHQWLDCFPGPVGTHHLDQLQRAVTALLRGARDFELERVAETSPPGRRARLARHRWAIVAGVFGIVVIVIVVQWLRETPGFFQGHAKYTAPTEVPTVAVLPLANLSNNPANDSLGIGVAETLISNLASVSGITVVSRAAPVISKSSGRDLVQAAHDLGVSFIVDGSVQQSDHRLHVTARLVRADGSVVWGGSYEGENAELFAMESQVAQHVTAALQLRLSQTERAKLEKQPTTDINAFADYAQGRSLLERLDVAGNLDRAIEFFLAAVGRDRNFVLAHAGLAEAYWARYQQTKNLDWTVKAREATLEALRQDPNQAAVRRLLALIYRGTGDTETAIQELHRALELQNSDDAHAMLGEILSDKGQIEDAIAEFDKAIALRPNFSGNYDAKGLALYRAGRFTEAAASFERVTQLQPDNASGFQRLGTTYYAAGDTEKALVNYRRSLELAPTWKTYTNLGVFYHNQGKFDDAAKAYVEALKLDPTSQITHANLGDVYQRLGRTDDARKEYTNAVQMTDRVLQVNSKDALTLSERAVYEAMLNRRLEAQRDANAAATLAPADGQVLYNKAVVHVLIGEKEAGLKALEQALAHGASAALARKDDYLQLIRGTPEFAKITADKH